MLYLLFVIAERKQNGFPSELHSKRGTSVLIDETRTLNVDTISYQSARMHARNLVDGGNNSMAPEILSTSISHLENINRIVATLSTEQQWSAVQETCIERKYRCIDSDVDVYTDTDGCQSFVKVGQFKSQGMRAYC